MNFCSNCGIKTFENANYCYKCGYKLVSNQLEDNLKIVKKFAINNQETFIDIISRFYSLNNFQIEKYKHKLNWMFLAMNENVEWSNNFFLKYEKLWYYTVIEHGHEKINWTNSLISKFKNRINWNEFVTKEHISWDIERRILFKDNIDWNGRCALYLRDDVVWDSEAIEMLNSKIDWGHNNYNSLSKNIKIYDFKLIDEFSKYWNFGNHKFGGLSSNTNLLWSTDLIDRYIHLWEWDHISTNSGINWSSKLMRRYESYINWKNISYNRGISWNLELLENYKDKLDWNGLVHNSTTSWNIEILEKFKEYINWKSLSNNRYTLWSFDLIEKFRDKWDWDILSSNEFVKWDEEILDNFGDQLVWKTKSIHYKLQTISGNKLPFSVELINKYFDKWDWSSYIPGMNNPNGLTSNRHIIWNKELLKNFKSYIKWDSLRFLNIGYWDSELVEIIKKHSAPKHLSKRRDFPWDFEYFKTNLNEISVADLWLNESFFKNIILPYIDNFQLEYIMSKI